MLSRLKPRVSDAVEPIASRLAKLGIRPNHLTAVGLGLGQIAAFYIIQGQIVLGAIFVLLSSFCDLLDGALARTQKMVTKFGGYLDSVVDRYVDVLIFISLGVYGVNWVIVAIAMSGALLVSYTRARAEVTIERCDVGFAERGERLVILFVGMVTGYTSEAVLLVAILSHITAIHRVIYTRTQMK